MSATGLEVFDKTIQTTNIWLNELMEELGPDRKRAYHVLQAVLHALRDRLSVDEAAHLSAQMPMLVRGMFFQSWHPAGKPERGRTQEGFLARVDEELRGIKPVAPEEAVRAVFRVLERHITEGEIRDVKQMLPDQIRRLWPNGVGNDTRGEVH